jgi:hypothetical protein
MGKGKDKVDGDNCTRERTILWDEDQTKFMLGWYMDFIKDQHAGFKVKKQHHFKCAESLNRQFNMGVTATQVERHFRHYKENWKFIATALNKSGNTFDTTRSMVIISESEKEKLKVFCFNFIFTAWSMNITNKHITGCRIEQGGSFQSPSNSSMKCRSYSLTVVLMDLLPWMLLLA